MNHNPTHLKHHPQPARLVLLVALTLVTLASVVNPAAAADGKAVPAARTLAGLQGPWLMTLTGDDGCGIATKVVTFTLNAAGSGLATIQQHTSVCGDGSGSNLPFQIQSLNADGSGTANLSCGTGCGWNFIIQVSKNSQVFNLVDVVDSKNYQEGTAIHQ
jgi:hypothetical protein